MKSSNPLILKPGFPYILGCLLVVAHLGAGIILWLLTLPAYLTGGAMMLLLVNLLLVCLRLPGLPRTNNICRLTWNSEGRWWLETFGGSRFEGELQGAGFVHPWLVVIGFQIEGVRGLRYVVLFPDTLDRETMRRLRVRLNVEGNKLSRDIDF